jgi:hydroxyacylglutathione hydrolase
MPVLRLADEQAINSFFRLSEPTLIEGLRKISPQLSAKASNREVFIRLRELRNDW